MTNIESIKIKNSQSLSKIDDFIKEINFKDTVFEYGAPDIIKQNINFNSNQYCYSDLICFLIKENLIDINYLEFGCSFGKNFWQIINHFNIGNYTACDIELPNHNVFSKLDLKSKTILSDEIFLQNSFVSHKFDYMYENKKIQYLRGNLLNEKIYQTLNKNNIKYNFIFSDAFHEDVGIRNELDNLIKFNLIDNNFIIYYDDMEFDNEFNICKQKLNWFFKKPIYEYKFNIYGWIYEREHLHKNAILTDINLEESLNRFGVKCY